MLDIEALGQFRGEHDGCVGGDIIEHVQLVDGDCLQHLVDAGCCRRGGTPVSKCTASLDSEITAEQYIERGWPTGTLNRQFRQGAALTGVLVSGTRTRLKLRSATSRPCFSSVAWIKAKCVSG